MKHKTTPIMSWSLFSSASTWTRVAAVTGLALFTQRAQAAQAELTANRAGVDYGFDAECGLDLESKADIWRASSQGRAKTVHARSSGCVIDGDQDTAKFRCFCAHQSKSLVGQIESSKIPKLRSFAQIELDIAESSLHQVCRETFQDQCGPLVKPLVAECGTPTRDFCKVKMRGDLKDEGYNLFDESCLCEGKRRWESSQRLSAPIGDPGATANARCQAQLDRCGEEQEPSFAPVQMLSHKGYTEQELRCSTIDEDRVHSCTVRAGNDRDRVGYFCECDGAEHGSSVMGTVELGAKSLYDRCQAQLQRCQDIEESTGGGEECDTSSSSADDCDGSDTSSSDKGNDTWPDDESSGDSSTGSGGQDPEPGTKPSDVLESLGCRAAGPDSGGWGLVWGVFAVFGGMGLRRRKLVVKQES